MIRKILLAACLIAGIGITASASDDLRDNFPNPPKEARPLVWWHWMDGNVSREGILKDLSWMHRSGIAGFHQFDAGGVNMPQAMPDKHVYFSDSWKEMLRYALHVADSLGMDVTIASAPGWSSTGGRWVAPEDAMKKIEWRSVVVGGGRVNVKLPSLYNCVGAYQDCITTNDRIEVKPYGKDLYVVAVRIPEGDLSMEELCSSVELSDSVITCRLRKPETVRAVTLHCNRTAGRPFRGEAACFNFLECSLDGVNWTPVCGICPSQLPYITVNIPQTRASWFRVRGERLAGLELSTVNRIEHAQEQAGFSTPRDLHRYATPESRTPVKDVVDLSGKMAPDGTLRCTLPRGKWRIYRFGASLTGKVNHPASPEATGLEVDKLDPEAWLKYFRTYVDMYREAAGGNLGQTGISSLLIDSYEAGIQTWTPRMPEQFWARRGYALTRWLPVLAGEIVGSSEDSEKFLWDWRKTIAELYAENYDRVDDIIREYGMKSRYTESHEGGRAFVGDGMDVKRNADIPMSAIWVHDTPEGSRIPAAISDIRESASVAHLYGKPVVAAESFTVEGSHQKAYTYVPENLKYTADIAISAGLNRFVIHESPAQPNDSYLPGLQLFRYGQWFHRNETWADYAYVWTDYLARSCFMLQQGHAVCDILVYYGEDSNATAQYGGVSFDTLFPVPDGYNYDYANPYAILHTLQPSDGRLITDSGMSYGVLVLSPDCTNMSVEVLQRIKAFADAGVSICGAEPLRCAGMSGSRKEFDALVRSIWHSGRWNVTESLDFALEVAGMKPELVAVRCGAVPGDDLAGRELLVDGAAESTGVDGRAYLVDGTGVRAGSVGGARMSERAGVRAGSVGGSRMSDGAGVRARQVPSNVQNGIGCVHRADAGRDIYWVRNFTGESGEFNLSFRSAYNCAAVFDPETGQCCTVPCTVADRRANVVLRLSDTQALFVVLSGSNEGIPAPAAELSCCFARQLDGRWTVDFNQLGGGTAHEEYDSLRSWTESSNPVVKYYAGKGAYSTVVSLSAEELVAADAFVLNLGQVRNLAEVVVNGQPAGVLWKAPFVTADIKPLLHSGENRIDITVANVWVNRMIGDCRPDEKHPVTKVRRFYKASDQLLPSGLLGPVLLEGRRAE